MAASSKGHFKKAFKLSSSTWKMGRVLNFAYYLEKYESAQVYAKTFNFADRPKNLLA